MHKIITFFRKKREKYMAFLGSVGILSTIDSYELGQISDALKTQKFKAGEKIINQGDEGDVFYILEEGTAHATKDIGKGAENVQDYQRGGFFGELSLIKDEPRAASVIADVRVFILTINFISRTAN
jgi:cAMP-dependent protein kinase regulator